VVALIALQNLRPDVAAQVQTLLATETHDYAGRYCSDAHLDPIAYYATWADDYRTSHPETAPWHFWDVPLRLKTAKENEFCDQGCVIQALHDQLAVLQDSTQDAGKRGDALMFIIHFVGDLHQPLHAEDNNDRGGNCVPAGFLEQATKETNKSTGSYSPNLHAIWDTQLVETAGAITTRSQEAIQAFAGRIEHDQSAVIQKAATEPVDFVKWGLESHSVARTDPYLKLPTKISQAKKTAPVTQCSDGGTSDKLAKKHETIQTSYVNAVSNDLEIQLARGGGRLAAVLNSAWPTPQH
jgi:hypothetical protein